MNSTKLRNLLLKAARFFSKPEKISMGFKQEHVENCKVLLNRIELLKKLPSGKTFVELGIDKGEFSHQILKYNKPSKLYCVDIDTSKSDINLEFFDKVELIEDGSVEFLIHGCPFVDVIYIDTTHTYKQTLSELVAANEVIREDGFICGHDYTAGNFNNLAEYGVIEAVKKFCNDYDYEMVYLTTEKFPSFALRKIK